MSVVEKKYPNMTVYHHDYGHVVRHCESRETGTLSLPGGGTVKQGTILARSSIDGSFVPFARDGSDGAGAPKAIMTYDVEVPSTGETSVQVFTAGLVNANRLIIHADGDGSNVDGSVLDLLRAASIRAQQVQQLGRFDNPDNDNG